MPSSICPSASNSSWARMTLLGFLIGAVCGHPPTNCWTRATSHSWREARYRLPYFTKIGYIPGNLSGTGARGYHIYRRSTRITVCWGGIVINRHRSVSIAWAGKTQHKVYYCRSLARARELMQEMIASRVELSGYQRLEPGQRIVRVGRGRHSRGCGVVIVA